MRLGLVSQPSHAGKEEPASTFHWGYCFSGIMTRDVRLQSAEVEETWGKCTWSSSQVAAGKPRVMTSSRWWFYSRHRELENVCGSDFISFQFSSQADRSGAQSHPQSCTATSLRGCWVYKPTFSCGSLDMLDHHSLPAAFWFQWNKGTAGKCCHLRRVFSGRDCDCCFLGCS